MVGNQSSPVKIRIKHGLPFVTILLAHQDQQLILDDVLLDTGSGGTIFSTDKVLKIGLQYAPEDTVHRIRGVILAVRPSF